MATMTAEDVSVLDPHTYGNGDPTTFGLPLDQYKYLREELPVLKQEFDDPRLVPKLWIVSRYDDLVFVDQDSEGNFSAAVGPPTIWAFSVVGDDIGAPGMLNRDGEDHRRQRRVVSRAFTPKMVAKLEERFRDYARDVVEKALAQEDPINFVSEIAHAMPMQALGDMLGVPEDDRPKFFGWVDTFAGAFDERVTTSYEEVLQAIQDLHDYSLHLRDLKCERPADDVATQVAEAHLPDPEVRGNITTLACGAAESTRNALCHGIHELMRNPDQMAWLRERADEIPATAVQEIVRIASPFTHMLRFAKRDVEIAGQLIPEGDPVAMLWVAGNFEETKIPEPNDFNLAREDNPHLSFGRGSHSCLGKHIAALEIKILFEELLQRTSDIRPVGEISYIHDNYSRGVYELPVELLPA